MTAQSSEPQWNISEHSGTVNAIHLQIHQHSATHDQEESADTGVEIDNVDKNIEQCCWVEPVQPISIATLLLFLHEGTSLSIHPQVGVGHGVTLGSSVPVSRLMFCRQWVWWGSWVCHWHLPRTPCTGQLSRCSSGSQAETRKQSTKFSQILSHLTQALKICPSLSTESDHMQAESIELRGYRRIQEVLVLPTTTAAQQLQKVKPGTFHLMSNNLETSQKIFRAI